VGAPGPARASGPGAGPPGGPDRRPAAGDSHDSDLDRIRVLLCFINTDAGGI